MFLKILPPKRWFLFYPRKPTLLKTRAILLSFKTKQKNLKKRSRFYVPIRKSMIWPSSMISTFWCQRRATHKTVRLLKMSSLSIRLSRQTMTTASAMKIMNRLIWKKKKKTPKKKTENRSDKTNRFPMSRMIMMTIAIPPIKTKRTSPTNLPNRLKTQTRKKLKTVLKLLLPPRRAKPTAIWAIL